MELSQTASEASGPDPSRHKVARQAGEGREKSLGTRSDEMSHDHTNLTPPGFSRVRPSAPRVSCTPRCPTSKGNGTCPLEETPSTPVSLTGDLCGAQLMRIQAEVRLCPFPGEEAGMDGQTDPTGQSCRAHVEAFPTCLFLPNCLWSRKIILKDCATLNMQF